ncbi:MAG: LL-diaminopimelate aminotransferase [Chloroflexi bacterium]|nr:LL-diaminopimelate aminotransferase [Chloroflexota bacterium]
MIAPSQRMSVVKPYVFAKLNKRKDELKAGGMDIIALDMGSPDLPPSEAIVDTLVKSARTPTKHGYGGFTGTATYRKSFTQYYARRFGVDLNPEKEALPLLGSKEGIYHTAFAYLNPGDVALVPDPGYPTYTAGTEIAGGTPYFMPLLKQNGWLPDLDAIPAGVLAKTKLMWLNYPNNPTAAIAPMSFFEKVVAFCKQNNILLCHDNPYCENGYDGYMAPSVLQIPGAKDTAIEFFSLSKSHNMAGMRVGVILGNADAVKTIGTLKTNVDSGPFIGVQDATIAALTGDQEWLFERQETYKERRDLVVAGLRAAGCEVEMPKATIYVWARIPSAYKTSSEWAEYLLEKKGVSLTPGTAFGAQGEGYVRISLGTPTPRVKEAMARIAG